MVAVFLLVAFSVPASAEVPSNIRFTYRVYGNNKTTLNPDNDYLIGDYGKFIYNNSGDSHSFGGVQNYSYLHQMIIIDAGDSVLFEAGKNYYFSFSGIKNTCIENMTYPDIYLRQYFSDGTKTGFISTDQFNINSDNYMHDIKFHYEPEKDTTRFYFWIISPHTPGTNASIGLINPTVEITEMGILETLFAKLTSRIETFFNGVREYFDEHGGLLGIIDENINWIGNLLNGVFPFLDNIYNTVKEIPGKILDIPGNIWSSFKQGIYEWLFPDDIVSTFGSRFDVSSYGLFFMPFDDFSDLYFDFFDNVLSLPRENFVLFFDIYDLFYEFIDDFVFHFESLKPESSFKIPKIEIPLSDGSFIFGPYTVNVVPEKFVFLCEYCRLFTSSVATLSFLFYMFLRVKGVFVR